jgi:hypothetical protein
MDQGQAHAVHRVPDPLEQVMDLDGGKHHGELAPFGRPHDLEDRQLAAQGGLIEEFDGARMNGHGAAGSTPLVDEMEEKVADLILDSDIRGALIILRQPLHGSHTALLGPRGQPVQLHVLDHPGSELGHGLRLSV